MVEFQFIDYESPTGAKQPAKKRAVKSHAALHHWARDAAARSARRARGRGRGRGRAQVFDLAIRGAVGTAPTHESSNEDIEDDNILIQTGCQVIEPLGAARSDPFHTYPVAWRPYIPEIVDHYIVNMATVLDARTGPCDGALIKTRFFPLAMSDPATFLTVLLLGASDLISNRQYSGVEIDLLRLKQQTIKAINEGLADPSRSCSDAMVGAVAKIGDYEARHGDRNSYMVHMNGLRTMIAMRGGLSNLGLDGIIRALCLWIDRHAASHIGTHRFFQVTPSIEPDSEQSTTHRHIELLNGNSVDQWKPVETTEGEFGSCTTHATYQTVHRPVRQVPTGTILGEIYDSHQTIPYDSIDTRKGRFAADNISCPIPEPLSQPPPLPLTQQDHHKPTCPTTSFQYCKSHVPTQPVYTPHVTSGEEAEQQRARA